jgi:hypothetical protein
MSDESKMTAKQKAEFAKEQRSCGSKPVPYGLMDWTYSNMSKTYNQIKCPACNLFHIWKLKIKDENEST